MSEAATDQQVEEGVEQSEQDYAADSDSGVAEGAEDSVEAEEEVADDAESDEEVELLSEDEINSLKGDPAKLMKALNTAATKKFQAIAKERKQLEPYLDLIEQLNSNPENAVRALASQLGLQIGQGNKEERQEQAKELGDILTQDVMAALGPEYGDLAERLAPAMRKVAERVANEVARPLAQKQQQLVADVAERESVAAIQTFEKTHPDFRKHEKAMVELSKKLQPAAGMNEQEYLHTLYTVVTASGKEGDAAKRIVKRINSSTKSGSDGPRVPGKEVKTEPSGLPTFAEAAEAAKRGEVW